MAAEPESLILQMLRDMRAEMADARTEQKRGMADLRVEIRSDMHTLRADMAADLLVHRKEFSEQIVGLRRSLIEYHTSVIGHGILISELEGRLRRVEQHLHLADG